MIDAGLNVIPCSDDPGMFPTTLAQEYAIVSGQIGASHAEVRRMALASAEASWLPGEERARLVASFAAEIASLDEEFGFAADAVRR